MATRKKTISKSETDTLTDTNHTEDIAKKDATTANADQKKRKGASVDNTEPITSDMPCPFEATVSSRIAILRKSIGLGTSESLKPVATLRHGTTVTVTAIQNGECLLKNGLWVNQECLSKSKA